MAYARAVGISSDERYEDGLRAYASQLGISPQEVPAWFAERFGERFGREAINAAGGAWPDDALSLRDRSLIVVAALIAQGGVEDRLRSHVRWAVEHGSNREELEALVTLLAVYAGFPRASVGMEIVREELDRMEETA
jgi:4-carboxymuconolactone decarboxylase